MPGKEKIDAVLTAVATKQKMGSSKAIYYTVLLACFLIASGSFCRCRHDHHLLQNQTATLFVNASMSRPIPDTLYGIFFEVKLHYPN